jgi:RNA polymerase sigma-70 factor (ECF subfamily)
MEFSETFLPKSSFLTTEPDRLQTSDAELVKGCLAGEHAAWETIVRLHHQRIYNLAYRFTGRFDEAEDLAQEIFLKVYRILGSYRPESGALITWIVRVGRNHLIDHYRRFKTERSKTDSLEVEYEKAEENPARFTDPAEALEQRELSERIHAALLRISEELREAVILRDLEGFTYEEIAETLKVPVGTVKSRINRGRLELAKIIRKQGDRGAL